MRPTEQEKMAIAKTVCDSWFPRRGATPGQEGPHGEAPEAARRNVGKSLRGGFCGEVWARQGEQA